MTFVALYFSSTYKPPGTTLLARIAATVRACPCGLRGPPARIMVTVNKAHAGPVPPTPCLMELKRINRDPSRHKAESATPAGAVENRPGRTITGRYGDARNQPKAFNDS